MTKALFQKSWNSYGVGAAIGVLSWIAFASADKPLGISTAFENTAALAEKFAVPRVAQTNEYFAVKEKEGRPPKIGWEWMLVVGVFVGSLVSSRLSGDHSTEAVPALWKWRFGSSGIKRMIGAFIGGALMMIGARLAQGCTSGHGISGSLQLAVSSWLFSAVFFSVATVTAFVLYGKDGAHHV